MNKLVRNDVITVTDLQVIYWTPNPTFTELRLGNSRAETNVISLKQTLTPKSAPIVRDSHLAILHQILPNIYKCKNKITKISLNAFYVTKILLLWKILLSTKTKSWLGSANQSTRSFYFTLLNNILILFNI